MCTKLFSTFKLECRTLKSKYFANNRVLCQYIFNYMNAIATTLGIKHTELENKELLDVLGKRHKTNKISYPADCYS